jgi:phosphatidylinositol alpha-1,6-mannosyltransferase
VISTLQTPEPTVERRRAINLLGVPGSDNDAEKLRLLLVTPDFPPSTGGIAVLMERLVSNLPNSATRVITFGQPDADVWDRESGLDVRRVASVDARRQLSIPVLNACASIEMARYRPQVLLSGHVVASISALATRRLHRAPLVQYVHADEFRVREKLTGRAVRLADATIAVSFYTREMALAAGADPARVHVIPPGVDVPAPVGAARQGRPTLLTVASFISERKGHDVILRALPAIKEAVPDVRWVTIGDGPLRGPIEAQAKAEGLGDRVEFLGRVDDAVRDEWLDRAHAFCMPSRVPPGGTGGEGFGIVYLEAGAHSLPVIAGNVAGALDAVIGGETGLLVNPEDPAAIAAAAIELLTDRERAEKMGAAGRANAEAHAWSRIGPRVEDLLRETAG